MKTATFKIGLISDTHGYLDAGVQKYFKDCDEIWHAGDIGTTEVLEQLNRIAPVRAVYGNIDGSILRKQAPDKQYFDLGGVRVMMTHIGGYPGKYSPAAKQLIAQYPCDIFICGHSHILRVMFDHKHQFLYMNPGAAGNQGFHQVKTLLRFNITAGKPCNLEVIELGKK